MRETEKTTHEEPGGRSRLLEIKRVLIGKGVSKREKEREQGREKG